MKKKISSLVYMSLLLIAIFAIGRVAFMWYNNIHGPASPLDILTCCLWGLPMDIVTTAYLMAIPAAVGLLKGWWTRTPMRGILMPYYIIICIVVCFGIIADAVMYQFWQFKLSAVILSYATSPEGASSSVTRSFIITRVVTGILFIGSAITCSILLTRKREQPTVHRIPALCILVTLAVGLIWMNTGRAYHSERLFLNHSTVNPAYHFASSVHFKARYARRYNYLTEEQRDETFTSLYPTDTEDITDTLLNTMRPNILLVQMESFGARFVEELGGIPGVAPNLSRLIPDGVWWTNCYSNSFRTDRGMVSEICGYLSYPDPGMMKQEEFHHSLPSLARSLKMKDYETDYLYGGTLTNMRKGVFLRHMDFDKMYDYRCFSNEELDSDWGAHDASSAKKAVELISQKDTTQQWFMLFQTISSHEPWRVPYHRLQDKELNSFAYTDECIGQMVDSLRTLPQWDNLLIILIPDHGHLYHQSYADAEFFHAPMLWLGGAVKSPRTISTILNQSDLAATLLSQMGISHREYPWSRNVLSQNYTYPFAYSNFPAGIMFKDSTGCTVFDVTAHKVISEDPRPSEQRLLRSKAILQTSYDMLDEIK